MPSAASVLQKCWDGKLPVNVERIADALGVAVRADPMMTEAGRISYNNGRPLIEVNGTDAPVRRRFTVAHELGHYALGHLRGNDVLFRDPASNFTSRTTNRVEREANGFAAQLLMPAEVLKYAVTEKKVWDISRLAKSFGVSEVAMNYRLQNLGLLGE